MSIKPHPTTQHEKTFNNIIWSMVTEMEISTCSSFLAYSLLMSKTNSTALGFTKSGGISEMSEVASVRVLPLRIAWVCKKQIEYNQNNNDESTLQIDTINEK